MTKILIAVAWVLILFCCCAKAGEEWTVTAYCACKKCCGENAQGIMANGDKVHAGSCAVNWLKFGTVIDISGLGRYTVKDRGAKRLFGTFKNPKKRVDIYMESHYDAVKFGIRKAKVEVVK